MKFRFQVMRLETFEVDADNLAAAAAMARDWCLKHYNVGDESLHSTINQASRLLAVGPVPPETQKAA